MVNDIVRIFVSSPSDLGYERSRAERVAERLSGLFDGLKIVPYRWEAGQYFSAHTNFQDAIPEVEAFDIVIGLFWSRLGTPLPPSFATMPDGRPYPSGTAFEILRAIEHRRKPGQGKPDVFVYRKMAGPPPAPPDDMAEQNARLERLAALNAFIAEWFVNEADGFKAAFTPFNTTDDFEIMLEAHLRTWLMENRRLGRERRWRVEERGSPFRGLDAFEADHRDVFFGRRADIERARERLSDAVARGPGFLLIEGASGTGKSSLARAGLLPRLADLTPDLRVARMRPEGAPLAALARALTAPGALPELMQGDYPTPDLIARHFATGGDPGPVLRALERARIALQTAQGSDVPPQMPLVLLIDQAEELFADAVVAEERQRFNAIVASLAQSGQVWVIATLRADARAAALQDAALAALIDQGASLSLAPPGPEALAEIVRAPAEAAGLAFETRAGEGLDEVLIAQARDTSALPLLQFLLAQLYERAVARLRAGGRRLGDVAADEPVAVLSFADFEALGGIEGAVHAQAEAAFGSLPAAAQAGLPRLVRALTDMSATGPVLRDASLADAAPDPAAQALVEALVAARILARDGQTLRFCHARAMAAWDRAAQAARDGAVFLRVRADVLRAIDRWQGAGRAASLLLPRGVPLAEAEGMLTRHADELPEAARGYIRASRARARRGQRLTVAAALVCASLAGVAAWQHSVARQEAVLAEAARVQAHEALRGATAAANALVFDLAQTLKDQGLPGDLTRAILTEAERLQTGLLRHFPDDVELQRSRSAALNETGALQMAQGDPGAAAQAFDQALAIARDLHAADPANPERQRDVAVSLHQLGDLHAAQGDAAAARAAFAEGGTILTRLAASRPDDPVMQRDVAANLERIGALDLAAGDLVAARQAFAGEVALHRRLTETDPDNADWQRGLWVGLTRIGDLEVQAGDGPAALARYREGLGIAQALAARNPDQTVWQRDLAVSLGRLGDLGLRTGDLDGAAAAYARAVAIGRDLARRDPDQAGWQRDLAVSLNKQGDLAVARGDTAAAHTAYAESLDLARAQAARDPEGAMAQRDLAVSLGRLGDLQRRAGDPAAAAPLLTDALQISRALAERDPSDPGAQRDLSVALDRLGDLHRRSDNAEAARSAYEEGLAIARAQAGGDPDHLAIALTLMKLADVTRGDQRRAVLTDALAILDPLATAGKLGPDQARWPDRLRAALASDGGAQ